MTTKEPTRFFAEEINDASAELGRWSQELAAVETQIGQGIQARDLEALIGLKARRDALPMMIQAAKAARDTLYKRRGEPLRPTRRRPERTPGESTQKGGQLIRRSSLLCLDCQMHVVPITVSLRHFYT